VPAFALPVKVDRAASPPFRSCRSNWHRERMVVDNRRQRNQYTWASACICQDYLLTATSFICCCSCTLRRVHVRGSFDEVRRGYPQNLLAARPRSPLANSVRNSSNPISFLEIICEPKIPRTANVALGKPATQDLCIALGPRSGPTLFPAWVKEAAK